MKNLKFQDLPAAMELALEKITFLEVQLRVQHENFQPEEPVKLLVKVRIKGCQRFCYRMEFTGIFIELARE